MIILNETILTPVEPLLLDQKFCIQLHEAYQSQLQIGWDNFSRGIISTKWKSLQYRHLVTIESRDIHDVDKWARTTIAQLLEFHRLQWIQRCDTVAKENKNSYEGRLQQVA